MLSNLLSYFFPKTLFKTTSKINGLINVFEFQGTRILTTGNTLQSGPAMRKIWEAGVAKLLQFEKKENLQNLLVLGLGGGNLINIIQNNIPSSKISVVEIDSEIINISKKYFNVNENDNLKIILSDAMFFIDNLNLLKKYQYYDAVFIDLFIDDNPPAYILEEDFHRKLSLLIKNNSYLIFNCLYGLNKFSEASIFLDKINDFYHDIFVEEVRLSRRAKNLLIFCKHYGIKS